ncbi:MAG: hypothetical protein IRZ28_13320 [Steroidobacteraceae bacterium]|nr:hypothetical protein [Steroidobacteraceae bacterium]
MLDRTLARVLFCAAFMGVLTGGCQHAKPLPNVPADADVAACPDLIQRDIALRVSVSAWALPEEFVTSEGVEKRYPFLARKMLIAVVPEGAARALSIVDSELTIAPFGGTFAGWATSSLRSTGLDVAPGRLRIDPYLPVGRFRPQTATVDAVVRLGGAAYDQSAVTTTALWDDAQRPTSPDVLQVTFTPLRHFTVYDAMNAKVTLRMVVQQSQPNSLCEATVESSVRLVDREAAHPPLWDLGTSFKGGVRKRFLALYDPTTGPVRAIFTDPVAARGFAMWLQQTGATHAGRYKIGTFVSEDLESELTIVPTDRAIMDSYHAITAEERELLKVGPLGER